jgi:glycosyltransferase involved in cell wall biosynthesis
MHTLEIAVFSYNRGAFLKNCIDSIERNLPNCQVKVYDDGSNEAETLRYLSSIAPKVITNYKNVSDRHGGYYANMQSAVANASSNFLLLLQDDMQIVRPVGADDLHDIELIFHRFERAAFLSPVFLKGRKRGFFKNSYSADRYTSSYSWENNSENVVVPGCYADVSIVNVRRLRDSGWVFQPSEEENGKAAKEKFGLMPQMSNPFTFYLPEEPAYRSKVLTLGAQLAFKMGGGSIKHFLNMTTNEMEQFMRRDKAILPFAEDFIQTADLSVKKPYKFNGYRKSALTMVVNKTELIIRRLLQKR